MSTKLTTEEFITRAKEVHGDKYDYSQVIYNTKDSKVCIMCHTHGDFWQSPHAHISGKQGCRACQYDLLSSRYSKQQQTFIDEATNIWGDMFDYTKVRYISANIKVSIVCKMCGDTFTQRPQSHLLKFHGCHSCKPKSIGESQISKWFIDNGIAFEQQKKFTTCKNKLPLPFDFYVPSLDLLIEFNGEQHYKPWHSLPNADILLDKQRMRDLIKTKWCAENNKRLLIIPYWKLSTIDDILADVIRSCR